MKRGTVYLIPVSIADDTSNAVLTSAVRDVLPGVRYFLVENARTARRYLSSLKIYESIEPLRFEILDKDTSAQQMADLFNIVMQGENVGIMSESGCPGIADPGSIAVDYAHRNDLRVVPLVGPSSIVLALMASGLNGQHFAFHGYLPIESKDLSKAIREYERESKQKKQTQIFIETPYRNNSVMKALLRSLSDSTRLTVALDLTGQNESIVTKTVKEWREQGIEFPKLPAVFLFLG